MSDLREDNANVVADVSLTAAAQTGALMPAAEAAPPPRRLQRVLSISTSQYLARRLQYVGKTGAGGIALIVFAIVFFMGANVSLKHEVEDLRADLRAPQPTQAADASPRQIRATAARGLMNTLPERSTLPALTGKIVAQAEAAGVALDRGSYDFTVTHSGHLVRARMTFPVHGRYPDIRRFIDSTLAAVPGAAVDGLRLGRKDIGSAEVDADIRFAVYLRSIP